MKHKMIKLLSMVVSMSLLASFSYGQDHDIDSEHHDHGAAHAEHQEHRANHADHDAVHGKHHGNDAASTEFSLGAPYLAMGLALPSEEFIALHSRLVREASMALAEANNVMVIVQWPYDLASNEVKAQFDSNRSAIKGLVPLYELAMQETDGTVLVKVLEDMADHWYAIRQLHAETLNTDELAALDQAYSNILSAR